MEIHCAICKDNLVNTATGIIVSPYPREIPCNIVCGACYHTYFQPILKSEDVRTTYQNQVLNKCSYQVLENDIPAAREYGKSVYATFDGAVQHAKSWFHWSFMRDEAWINIQPDVEYADHKGRVLKIKTIC